MEAQRQKQEKEENQTRARHMSREEKDELIQVLTAEDMTPEDQKEFMAMLEAEGLTGGTRPSFWPPWSGPGSKDLQDPDQDREKNPGAALSAGYQGHTQQHRNGIHQDSGRRFFDGKHRRPAKTAENPACPRHRQPLERCLERHPEKRAARAPGSDQKKFLYPGHRSDQRPVPTFVDETGYRTQADKGGGRVWNGTTGKSSTAKGFNWRQPQGMGSGIQDKLDHPVVFISWNDARAFIQWLSRKEGRNYSLPTEEQWEYACRGGQPDRVWPWGKKMTPEIKVANLSDAAWSRRFPRWISFTKYDDGFVGTSPVASFLGNGYGLFDMVGNVREWCRDPYRDNYYGSVRSAHSGRVNQTKKRVLRGGAWNSSQGTCVRHPEAGESSTIAAIIPASGL